MLQMLALIKKTYQTREYYYHNLLFKSTLTTDWDQKNRNEYRCPRRDHRHICLHVTTFDSRFAKSAKTSKALWSLF